MTDQSANQPTEQTKAKKSMGFILPVLLAIVVIAVVGYIATTRSGIDKQLVEGVVKQWAERVHAYGEANGEDITVVYDEIEMKGEAAGRHAILKNAALVIKAKQEESEAVQTTKISTAALELHPTSALFDSFKVVAAQPIESRTADHLDWRLSSVVPIALEVVQARNNSLHEVKTHLAIPEVLNLSGSTEDDAMVIKTQPGAVINNRFSADMTEMLGALIKVGGLQIESTDGQKFLQAKAIALNSDSEVLEDGNYQVVLTSSVDDLMTTDDDMPYGALNVAVDVSYRGPLPQKNEVVDWASTPAALEIRRIDVSTRDAAANLDGAFTTGGGELLPVGKATLKVNHFDFVMSELKRKGIFDKESEKVTAILLQKMTGKPIAEIENLELVLEREQGGSLKLGKMSFEEALAVVLTGGKLSGEPAAKAPAPKAKGN